MVLTVLKQQQLEADIKEIYSKHLKIIKPMLPLNDIQNYEFELNNVCHICGRVISDPNDEVKDHDHLCGFL